jgi:hypothetical protein
VRRTACVDVSGGSTAAAQRNGSLNQPCNPRKGLRISSTHSPRGKGLETWSIDEVMLVELQSMPNPPFGMDERKSPSECSLVIPFLSLKSNQMSLNNYLRRLSRSLLL